LIIHVQYLYKKFTTDTTVAGINYKEKYEREWDPLDIDKLYYMHWLF